MKKYPVLLVSVLLFSLLGCGGGGDEGGGGEPQKPSPKDGVFLDSPVQGVAYSSGSLSGFTGPNGEYQYESGKPVIFSIGDLIIGQIAQGQGVLTPLDFGSSQLGINVARFLQSIDQDAVPSNGIAVTEAMRAALTGGGATINFDQEASAFANDSAVQSVVDTLAPLTDASVINLRTVQETIEHLSSELRIDILQSDVAGTYETVWADMPASIIDYQFSNDMSGGIDNGTSTENATWEIDAQNRLLVTPASSAGLPQRFTLIKGTLDDGVLTAEVDEDADGMYDRFTLVTINRVSGSPGNSIVTHCGMTFDTDVSANIAAHDLQFPITSNWNFEPYNDSTATAEYLSFTTEIYNGIPATRVDTYLASDGSVYESLWLALATDGAVYDLNQQVEGTDYPCSTPRMRYPATVMAGTTWPIEVEGFQGQAEIVSTNAGSPAGYTNTIKISMTFEFGVDSVVYDNYFRIGEGLLDTSDNISKWLKRTDITPENPPATGGGNVGGEGDFGTLNLSSVTISEDNGAIDMVAAINVNNASVYSITWSGVFGSGVSINVLTSLGTVSLTGPSGSVYACSCQPVLDFTNMTATFTNIVVSDDFPFPPGAGTNLVTINGTLTIPAASN